MGKRRIILICVFFILLVVLVAVSWKLSSETFEQSSQLSIKITNQMINWLDKNFNIDTGDTFWKVTFHKLIRKAAHFIEYTLIGCALCAMLNLMFNRALPAALISLLVSPLFGVIDEYHQRFASMRTPKSLDIWIDTAGVVTGIIMVTVFFLVFNYIGKLKKRIIELDQAANKPLIKN